MDIVVVAPFVWLVVMVMALVVLMSVLVRDPESMLWGPKPRRSAPAWLSVLTRWIFGVALWACAAFTVGDLAATSAWEASHGSPTVTRVVVAVAVASVVGLTLLLDRERARYVRRAGEVLAAESRRDARRLGHRAALAQQVLWCLIWSAVWTVLAIVAAAIVRGSDGQVEMWCAYGACVVVMLGAAMVNAAFRCLCSPAAASESLLTLSVLRDAQDDSKGATAGLRDSRHAVKHVQRASRLFAFPATPGRREQQKSVRTGTVEAFEGALLGERPWRPEFQAVFRMLASDDMPLTAVQTQGWSPQRALAGVATLLLAAVQIWTSGRLPW